MDEGISLGLVMALVEEATGADPAVIEQAVQDWLDAHPEATTTVADGSITEQKLAAAVAAKINQVTQLSDEIVDVKNLVSNVEIVPMFLDFTADLNWISQNTVPLWDGAVIERLADGSTDCNNPYFIVSGNAGDSYVTIESGGNALISDMPTDKNWGAVLSPDGINYKTCNAQYRDANTISVYPPLTESFSNGVLGYNKVGIHLTKRGYLAYCQKAMSLNPKWCEKSGVIASYRVGDTVPWTKFGGLMSADIANSNIGASFVNKYYQRVYALSFYNSWTSHQTPSGIEWDIDLSGKDGYMELIIGGFNAAYLEYPTGQEFHIELYLDGELSYSYVKTTQICERLCADVDGANTAKLKIYSNKWSAVDGATYGLSISQITFWENKKKYETNEPLIKPFVTIAQMFDSWGVFHNGITATELARLHRLQGNNIYVPYENHSFGSQTSAWGCGWFYENVWKYHPSTMLVDFSINDKNSEITTGFPATVVGSDGTVYNNIITQNDYIRNMSDLCNMAIRNGIQPVMFGSYLIGTCDYWQALCYAWASQQ